MATFNKDALVERVYEFDNFDTKVQSKRFVEDFFGIITTEVGAGNTVNIAGFGKFEPFKLANGKVVPKFRPFEAFKLQVA